ncbi:Alkaline phosphatase synthesis transcriptional regulatory protein SphR [bioreactor metagenome]
MKSPGRVYTKVQIGEIIKGDYSMIDENSIMVHISRLREKIENDPKNPTYIKTIRGVGYKIEKIKEN